MAPRYRLKIGDRPEGDPMKSKKLLLPAMLAATLALSGCAGTGPRLPERVLVPVAVECPVPDVPAAPVPPASLHDKNSSDADKARAIAVYLEQLHGHIDALTALLAGYAKPDPAKK